LLTFHILIFWRTVETNLGLINLGESNFTFVQMKRTFPSRCGTRDEDLWKYGRMCP